jgi:hypothetical protein
MREAGARATLHLECANGEYTIALQTRRGPSPHHHPYHPPHRPPPLDPFHPPNPSATRTRGRGDMRRSRIRAAAYQARQADPPPASQQTDPPPASQPAIRPVDQPASEPASQPAPPTPPAVTPPQQPVIDMTTVTPVTSQEPLAGQPASQPAAQTASKPANQPAPPQLSPASKRQQKGARELRKLLISPDREVMRSPSPSRSLSRAPSISPVRSPSPGRSPSPPRSPPPSSLVTASYRQFDNIGSEIENDIEKLPATHADLPQLLEEMKEWNRINNNVITSEDRTGKRVTHVTYKKGAIRS